MYYVLVLAWSITTYNLQCVGGIVHLATTKSRCKYYKKKEDWEREIASILIAHTSISQFEDNVACDRHRSQISTIRFSVRHFRAVSSSAQCIIRKCVVIWRKNTQNSTRSPSVHQTSTTNPQITRTIAMHAAWAYIKTIHRDHSAHTRHALFYGVLCAQHARLGKVVDALRTHHIVRFSVQACATHSERGANGKTFACTGACVHVLHLLNEASRVQAITQSARRITRARRRSTRRGSRR